jgi:hypothetical protein
MVADRGIELVVPVCNKSVNLHKRFVREHTPKRAFDEVIKG